MKLDLFKATLTATTLIACISCSTIEQPLMKSFKGERIIPDSANRLLIKNFSNSTARDFPALEMHFRLKGLISEDGRLAAVDTVDECDLMLTGTVTTFTIQNIRFDSSGTAVKRRIRLVVDVNLVKCRDNTVILKNRTVEAHRTFSETVQPIENENRAVLNLIDTVNKRITSLLISGWYTERMTPVERGKK